MRLRYRILTLFLLLLSAGHASAQGNTLSVSGLFAGGITWGEIINNITGTLGVTIFAVAAAVFLIGALMYTGGFVNEEYKNKGKQLMIGSLFGMGIVLAAKAIFNAAYFFVYGT